MDHLSGHQTLSQRAQPTFALPLSIPALSLLLCSGSGGMQSASIEELFALGVTESVPEAGKDL